jgi:hypothetical protein
MAHRKNEIVEKSYYTLILCCFFICEIKRLATKNKKAFEFLYFPEWMSKLTNYCNCLFYFQVGWGGGGVVWGWLYLVNSLQTSRQPPSCIVKFLQILCSSCIYFDSGYSLVALGRTNVSFPFFYYDKINLHLGISTFEQVILSLFSEIWIYFLFLIYIWK